VLATGEATPPEKDGSLASLPAGPFGPLSPRAIRFADGKLSLGGEPPPGDVYLYAVDVTVPEKGHFVLRTVSSMDHVALLDGTAVLSRLTSRRPASTLTTGFVKLDAGTHRLLVRMTRESQSGQLTVALQRVDGAPAKVTFAAASGPAPRWDGVKVDDDRENLFATAESVRLALEDEGGDALARFIAARDALGRDLDGARAMVAGLPESVKGPAVAVLRADVALLDRSTPTRVGRGRATRELEAALLKDPEFVAARMATAQLALDDGRQLDALEQARAAKTASPQPGAPVLQLIARVEMALGLDAAAALTAQAADQAMPGACDALLLQFDLARRRDAVKDSDVLLGQTGHCQGFLARSAEHLRSRGDIDGAVAQWEALLARDEGQVPIATSLVGLYVAQKRFDDAKTLLARLRAQWPRHPQLPKTLGDVLEVSGDVKGALEAREAALALDGADLPLRRAVERQKTGKELLEAWAISTEEALKSYEAAPGSEDATSAFVLDAAAIQAFPDGTMVDRVHIIQKALDQQGVQEVAEVQIPAGATVLKLRTLKPDGRALEPENIEGKEDMSLPGVQVGDLVEYEYLLAHPTRGPAMPGFTASAFYFQVARQPNARSSYVVIAPKGSGLEVDAHNVKAPKPQVEGEYEVLRHEERRVPPYIPEPLGPPSANEWLPFVSVGAGQRGNEGVVKAYADSAFDRGTITWEVEAFARESVKGSSAPYGLDAVKRVYAAVHQKLSGRDAGLGVSAASSVAQDRGSRIWLMKSSLEALGIEARLVAVRAFTSDPAAYVFPNEGLLPYICLRVNVGGETVWLDPLVRYAPFGELPEFALGGLEAWVLPEPGRALEKTTTPARSAQPAKRVTLELTLNEAGELTGTGQETYTGSEAAQLAEALESLSADQRDQALQSALSRYFGGADLSKLEVKMEREVGAPVVVRYEFIARRFARQDGDTKLIASSLTYPLMVGRRFLALPQRVTPLFIEASEASSTKATLKLPAGWALKDPLPEVKLAGPSGTYVRKELQAGGTLVVEEDFRLTQSRVPTKLYEAFGQFAGEVDLVQQRDLLFEKR
jgi:tetratricopeptide (TPR) repeat protein